MFNIYFKSGDDSNPVNTSNIAHMHVSVFLNINVVLFKPAESDMSILCCFNHLLELHLFL